MRKTVLFMHTSLDNFVAGPQGEMNWINANDEIFTYASQSTRAADTALYGRKTYEMMESYWPTAADQPNPSAHDLEHAEWYNRVTKVVISTTLQGSEKPRTIIFSERIAEQVQALKATAGKDILIFGSPSTVHFLMQENLIDEFWLFVNPIVLGKGIPLFKGLTHTIKLDLIKRIAFDSGVVCLHYKNNRETV
ncbi:dihydrofolate reductase family protein [Chitinophaga nivalis]|uniref:Dihydrofolate reductase family protein n=1 Tax=Chitinophaga nivalis TaxID=2991709 RepID=A0ABT3IKL2_9BACT|nr:dihydrofolate reductase family protein [Chitinophaga nivalis]MCW3465808.1 dihydrofolate reductase family protein [Chitinophaga nivalis]MCW3484501.1 dihydrofolate reductase family protein [Chitinophaga nivalis]